MNFFIHLVVYFETTSRYDIICSDYLMKVLHIDDAPEICELYADMFAIDEHEVQSTNTAQEGLDLALKNDYDLILLDLCMPKYGGMNFLRDLKNKRPSELRKVIVVSVLQMTPNQTKELKKMGIHSVEEKPTNLQQLENIKKNAWLK